MRILRLGPDDAPMLDRVADDVFDDDIDPAARTRFLAQANHHLFVAVEEDEVIGFVSAVLYDHPDKPAPEFWLNEVGVTPAQQGKGIGKQLMAFALDHARALGCNEAWVLTDRDNAPAMALYAGQKGAQAPSDHVMFNFDLSAR